MSITSWAKGKMVARIAVREAEALRAGRLATEQADLIRDMANLINVHEEMREVEGCAQWPLDVRLQWLIDKPLSPIVVAAHHGRVPWTPTEVWTMLFTAVIVAGRHDERQLAQAVTRLEDRAAERRR